MNQNIRDSIVLITSSDPELSGILGTGFIIHHDEGISYVLTCAHVVEEVGGFGKVNIEVDGHPVTEFVNGDRYGCDLAILAVKHGLSKLPALKLSAVGEEGREFVISGYFTSAKTRRLEDIKGKLGRPGLINNKGDRSLSWNLEISEDSKHKLKDGYSGSPVVDKDSSYVLGVVSQRAGQKEGLAISIEALEKVWLEMPTGLIINSQKIKQEESNHSKSSTSISQLKIILRHKQEELDRKQIQLQELHKVIDDIERRRNLVDILEKARYDARLEDLNIAYNRIKKDLENLSKEIEEVHNKLN